MMHYEIQYEPVRNEDSPWEERWKTYYPMPTTDKQMLAALAKIVASEPMLLITIKPVNGKPNKKKP